MTPCKCLGLALFFFFLFKYIQPGWKISLKENSAGISDKAGTFWVGKEWKKHLRRERRVVCFYFNISTTERHVWFFSLFKSWWAHLLVLNGTALSAEHPVTLTRYYWTQWSLTFDSGLVPIPRPLKLLALPSPEISTCRYLNENNRWVIVTGSTISPDYWSLNPEKSHFTLNHTVPANSAWMIW